MITGQVDRLARLKTASSEPNRPQKSNENLVITVAVTVAGLNIAVLVFFFLWLVVGSTAIDQLASASSVDSDQVLPSSKLMWLVAVLCLC